MSIMAPAMIKIIPRFLFMKGLSECIEQAPNIQLFIHIFWSKKSDFTYKKAKISEYTLFYRV